MARTPSTVLHSEDEDIQEVSQASAILWRRLGIEALPAHETMFLPTERLIVAGANQLMRSAKRLVKSVRHVGILQNPSVVVLRGIDIHDAEATFEVIAGRRRVLAGCLAGLTVIKCEVYAASTMPLSALLALIENEQRSAAWVREVEALRCLIDEGVGMTLDDLAAFGFDRATLAERLKIAQLSTPLLNRVLAGNVSREVARKLVRLTQTQQERVASLADTGEEITAERVNTLLRAQINAGLLPVQAALLHPMMPSPDHATLATNGHYQPLVSTPVAAEPMAVASTPTLTQVLAMLQAFELQIDAGAEMSRIRGLTKALVQELHIVLREQQHRTIPQEDERSDTHV